MFELRNHSLHLGEAQSGISGKSLEGETEAEMVEERNAVYQLPNSGLLTYLSYTAHYSPYIN